jgi:hypothetical protein
MTLKARDKQLLQTESPEKSDDERLEDIRDWLRTRLRPPAASHVEWIDTSLNYCLDLIEEIKDENESLWRMLDELKESEMESWAKDNEGMLQEHLEDHVKKLKWHNKMKGDA